MLLSVTCNCHLLSSVQRKTMHHQCEDLYTSDSGFSYELQTNQQERSKGSTALKKQKLN